MPKLAIYIPKKDMREIDQWRKKLNFSQIFMRALRQEIRERSRLIDAPDEQLAQAAEYYRQALTDDSESLVDIGYQLGCTQVLQCAISPAVIRRLCELNDTESSPSHREEIVEAMGGKQALKKLVRGHDLDDRTHPMWRESICLGFVKGVADTWARVCERMRAHDPED